MNLSDFDKQRIFNEFSLLSEELSLLYPNEKFSIWLVGGVPLMEYTNLKKSGDIDIWTISDNKILPLLEKHFMNKRAHGMSTEFSSDMESRFKKSDFFSKANLSVYTPSLEDIVANKLLVNRNKDWEDITDEEVIINVDLYSLERIIKDELVIDVLPKERYTQLLRVYDKWKEHVENVLTKKKGIGYGR